MGAWNPPEDLARKTVEIFWTTGLDKQQALIRACKQFDGKIPRSPEKEWEQAWSSPNMQEAHGEFAETHDMQSVLPNKQPQFLMNMMHLSENAESENVRERTTSKLAELSGMSPKREVEVTMRNEYESMGVEALIEVIEKEIPLRCEHCGREVQVDRSAFVEGVF